MTICQMSTIDGSPKLERQVQKITMQMSNQCPTLKAAGYFNVGRNMILKVCIYVVLTIIIYSLMHDRAIFQLKHPSMHKS